MKKLADEETIVLNVKIPKSLGDRVDKLAVDEHLANRSVAARLAIERGLDVPTTNGART